MAKDKRLGRKTVRDLVPDDLSVRDLKATTKEEAIAELLNVLVIGGVLDLDRERGVLESILEREKVASTGIGNGIAIPHAKNKFATRFAVAAGLSAEGIEFGSHDDMPVFVVVLWVCPPSATPEHLALMRGIALVARDANMAGTLSAARDKRGFLAVLEKVAVEEKK